MTLRKVGLFILLICLSGLILGCGGGGESGTAPEVKPRGEGDTAPVGAGDATAGKGQYDSLCGTCHGVDAKGLPSLGKDLTTSDFLATKTDAEFLDFVKVGRPSGDPLNTTGIDMPPRGGNPALTDDDIMDIIAYVRTLEE